MGSMVERGIGTMGAVIWGAVGLGCGGNTETADADSDWPKRVTLQASFAQASDAVRLADGEIVAQGGDVAFTFAVQLSLHQPDEALPIFCEKGKHEALAEVPADEETCLGSGVDGWEPRLFLSAGLAHEVEE